MTSELDKYIERERKYNAEKVRKYLKAYDKKEKEPLRKAQLNIGMKLVAYAVLSYVAAGFVVGISHELGHAAVCASDGFQFRIGLRDTGFFMGCSGMVNYPWLQDLAGPLAGLGIAVGLTVAGKYFLPLFIAGGAYAVDQAVKVGIEGFVNSTYQAGGFNMIMTIIQLGSLLAFIVLGLRHSYKEQNQKIPNAS